MRNPFRRRRGAPLFELDLSGMGFPSPFEGKGGAERAPPSDGMTALAAVLSSASHAGRSPLLDAEPSSPSPVEVQAILRSFAVNYGRCPFSKGDFVMRRANTGGHGEGWPALVLEVSANPHQNFYLDSRTTPESDPDYGARYDMRILHRNEDGRIHAHWVESWLFEPYGGALTVGVDAASPDAEETVMWEHSPEPDEDLGKRNVTTRLPDGQEAVPGSPVEWQTGFALAVSTMRLLTNGFATVPWRGEQVVDSPVFFDRANGTYNGEGRGQSIPGWRLAVPQVSYPTIEVR